MTREREASQQMFTGKVIGLKRMQNTADGNPRWRVVLETWDGCRMQTMVASDSAVAYVIGDSIYAENEHTFGFNAQGLLSVVLS